MNNTFFMFLFFSFYLPNHFCGHATDNRVGGYIHVHYRTGCNDGIVADGYSGEDCGVGSNPDVTANIDRLG